MILITGATGNFGSSTAQHLQQRQIPFRGAARNLEALKKRFGSKTELATFDWGMPETFTGILKSIATVYIAPPPLVNSDFHITAKPFIESAKKAGVKHIVVSTALYSDNPKSIFYGTEALVRNSGIDFTIIRPSFVFQNFLNQFLQSVRNGVILAPSEKGKTSYVDIRNVGEASAVVLQNPSVHKGKIYAITGSEALTHSQMADIFSQLLSKEVAHVSPSVAEYKKYLASLNVPDFMHDFLAQLYGTIANGQWERVTNDYTLLTGKKTITFAEFVKENRMVFSQTPAQQEKVTT